MIIESTAILSAAVTVIATVAVPVAAVLSISQVALVIWSSSSFGLLSLDPRRSDPRRSDPLSLGPLLRPVSACTVRIWDLVQAGSWGLCVLMYQADM